MCVEGHSEGRVTRPGVKVKERSQLRDERDGSEVKVALQCTDIRLRMSDDVTLCSPLVGGA